MKKLMTLCVLCLMTALSWGDTLDSLDTVLAQRDKYVAAKQHSLAQLSHRLNMSVSVEEQLFVLKTLAAEYSTFCFDSAMVYTNRLNSLAVSSGKKEYECYSRIARASLLTTSGLFPEAIGCLDSINRKMVNDAMLPDYFKTYEWAYSMWAEYAAKSPYASKYYAKELAYQDSLINVLPTGTVEHNYWQGEKAYRIGDYEAADKFYHKAFAHVRQNERLYAQTAFGLALTAEAKGNSEKYVNYLILAVISDQICPLKENLALQVLALDIAKSENPDYKRANRYLQIALEDAKFYGNRLRMLEIAQKIPHIVTSYEGQLEQANNRQHIIIIVVGILALFLILAVAASVSFMRRLHRERLLLQQTGKELKTANEKVNLSNMELREQTRLRESCISLFIELTAAYINKLNVYQTTVQRKVKANQTADLLKLTNPLRMSELDAREFFMSFDKTFLRTFPNFIVDINALLNEEKNFKQSDSLNLHLRILALMRLGVRDSSKIATLLNCSQQTVYNLRSTVKAKAKNKESFDSDLMKV